MAHSNIRKPNLVVPEQLASEFPESLQEPMRKLLSALNARFSDAAELHGAAAGLSGTVGIAKQDQRDSVGNTIPGLELKSNRIAGVAPPVNGQDVVTKDYLDEQLNCPRLTKILANCNDEPDTANAASACTALSFSLQQSLATGYDSHSCYQVWAKGNYVYTVGVNAPNLVLNIYNAIHFELVGTTSTSNVFANQNIVGVLDSDYLYVTNGAALLIFDVTEAQNPVFLVRF